MDEKIENDSVLKFIEHSSHQEDPLQPIVDIVRAAVMKYDFETARNGIADIKDRCLAIVSEYSTEYGSKEEKRILKKPRQHRKTSQKYIKNGMERGVNQNSQKENKKETKKIVVHFSNHLEKIAKLAIGRSDEKVAIEAINSLKEIGMGCIEKRLAGTALITFESEPPGATITVTKVYETLPFELIELESSENRLEGTIEGTADILQEIGRLCIEKEFKKVTISVMGGLAK